MSRALSYESPQDALEDLLKLYNGATNLATLVRPLQAPSGPFRPLASLLSPELVVAALKQGLASRGLLDAWGRGWACGGGGGARQAGPGAPAVSCVPATHCHPLPPTATRPLQPVKAVEGFQSPSSASNGSGGSSGAAAPSGTQQQAATKSGAQV